MACVLLKPYMENVVIVLKLYIYIVCVFKENVVIVLKLYIYMVCVFKERTW